MEYVARDVFLDRGWPDDLIAATVEMYEILPSVAEQAGIAYVDWLAVFDDYVQDQGSTWSRFALYVDGGHLSRLGNEIGAEELLDALRRGA
jgi:lysophospholipase L1-like esterase